MYEVQQYNPKARKYKTVRRYSTWGAANSRVRFISGKVRLLCP